MGIEASNYQWKSGSVYRLGDRGTAAWGVKTPQMANLVLFEGFETLPLEITFGDNGSNAPWAVNTQFAYEGIKSFRSGSILNNQFSDATALIPGGPIISFYYKVSSEENFDFFEFYMDGTLLLQVSGEVDWTLASFPTAGFTDFTFRYVKDGFVDSGFDAVWVDNLSFGDAPADSVYWPLKIDENNALVVNGVDIGIRPLTCDVDSVTICPGDDPLHVIVDNTITVQSNDLDIRPLNCATDSIEICNDIGNPVPVSFTRLSCATDSVEICNDAGTPITVSVTNIPHVIVDSLPEVEIKNDAGNPIPVSFTRLTCATDSVEICNDVGNPITVNVTNIPHVIVDSIPEIEIKNDIGNPIPVTGSVSVTGSITVAPRSLRGVYHANAGIFAVNAAAHAAKAGYFWIVNTHATITVAIRRIYFLSVQGVLSILTNSPSFTVERMTFTGSPSGAQVVPAKRDSLDPTNTGTLRTASTGMVITPGAAAHAFTSHSTAGLVSLNVSTQTPVDQVWPTEVDADEFLVLRAGQGIVVRQATAGSVGENRSVRIDVTWEERN